MGTSLRIFLVDDDDGLHPLSQARYERLLKRDPEESLPQYAGCRVRCAVVVVETAGHEPIAVSRIVYSYIPFDKDGRMDLLQREKETRLAMESIAPLDSEPMPPQVVDARHLFARKRYEREFRWKPARRVERNILSRVFGRKTSP